MQILDFSKALDPGYIDEVKQRSKQMVEDAERMFIEADKLHAFSACAESVVAVMDDVPVFSNPLSPDVYTLPHEQKTFRYLERDRSYLFYNGDTFSTGTYDETFDNGKTPRESPDSITVSVIRLGNKYYFLINVRYSKSPRIRYKFLCLTGTSKRFSITNKKNATNLAIRIVRDCELPQEYCVPDRSGW